MGSFFEDTVRTLFSGDICEKEFGDAAQWQICTGFESKASDNNHFFRIKLKQLMSHLECRGGFPYNSFVYCLFSYRNRETVTRRGKRRSILSRCQTKEEVRTFLAQTGITLYVLDIEVMEALSQKLEVVNSSSIAGHYEPVVELSHTMLKEFQHNGKNALRTLGINPESWRINRDICEIPVDVDLFTFKLRLKVVKVVRRTLKAKLASVFRGKTLSIEPLAKAA